ncbi:MAG: sensor histidine kinase [Gemmatimonadota bacterium]|nr:sensor histidine kinase [Gemmatimonadota bacterium]
MSNTNATAPLPASRDRIVPVLLAGIAMWAIGAVSAAMRASGAGLSMVLAVLGTVPPLLYWVALTPAILWIQARTPIRRDTLLRAVLVHAAAGAVTALGYIGFKDLIAQGYAGRVIADALQAGSQATPAVRFQLGLFSYSFLAAWGYIHELFARMRARELAAARLETELADARLRALKAQLHPHFLFNTLHAITVLIRRDAEEATRTVLRLSDLLRQALADGERQETTLASELHFVRLYLEIEQTRFRERLRVEWAVEPGLDHATVPTLVLQPLVENAIKHGIEPRAEGGLVRIGARREGDTLRLTVVDDGPGFGAGAGRSGGEGIGLASTRGRLALLYGERQRCEIGTRAEGGTEVRVMIPFSLAAGTAGAAA